MNGGMRFRFHTGSIKRPTEREVEKTASVRFDSILVRLKDQDKPANQSTEPGFDSILVRLKGAC